jgi:hypothetical protein
MIVIYFHEHEVNSAHMRPIMTIRAIIYCQDFLSTGRLGASTFFVERTFEVTSFGKLPSKKPNLAHFFPLRVFQYALVNLA